MVKGMILKNVKPFFLMGEGVASTDSCKIGIFFF